MRRRRGGSSISFKFLLPPKIAATASRPSPITHALRAITKSAKRGAKRNAIRLNNNTERIRFVPASPPPILLRLALHRWLILDRLGRREAAGGHRHLGQRQLTPNLLQMHGDDRPRQGLRPLWRVEPDLERDRDSRQHATQHNDLEHGRCPWPCGPDESEPMT
jgi:hypothetical protein